MFFVTLVKPNCSRTIEKNSQPWHKEAVPKKGAPTLEEGVGRGEEFRGEIQLVRSKEWKGTVLEG